MKHPVYQLRDKKKELAQIRAKMEDVVAEPTTGSSIRRLEQLDSVESRLMREIKELVEETHA